MSPLLASALGNGVFGLVGVGVGVGVGGLSSWLIQRSAFEHERRTRASSASRKRRKDRSRAIRARPIRAWLALKGVEKDAWTVRVSQVDREGKR